MNPASNIADYLATNLLGTVGVDIFDFTMPDDVDNGVVLTDLGGEQPDTYTPVYTQFVDVLVRNKNSTDCYSKARSIFNLLSYKSNLTVGNMYVYHMHPTSDVESAGRDMNNRALLRVTIKVIYREPIS